MIHEYLLDQKNYTNFLKKSGLDIEYAGSFTDPPNIQYQYNFVSPDLT